MKTILAVILTLAFTTSVYSQEMERVSLPTTCGTPVGSILDTYKNMYGEVEIWEGYNDGGGRDVLVVSSSGSFTFLRFYEDKGKWTCILSTGKSSLINFENVEAVK